MNRLFGQIWDSLCLLCSAEGNECIKANALSCGECIQVGAKCGWCTDTVSSVQMPCSFFSLTLHCWNKHIHYTHNHSRTDIQTSMIMTLLLYNSSINERLILRNLPVLLDQTDILPNKMTQTKPFDINSHGRFARNSNGG